MTRVPTTPPEPSGRLELTWTNKHLRLLAHDDTTYEWCDPADYRVAEVRLLNEVTTVGDDPGDNLVIQGDAMHALDALLRIPEFADRYAGKVRCCYIDPPFNTGKAFRDYDDALEHSVWLTLLRDRLLQIQRLLSADGSVWLHLDDAEVHRARAVLDDVFGPENFVAEVVWQKADSPRSDAGGLSISHDSILVYRKSPAWAPNRLARLQSTDDTFGNQDGDPTLWRKKDPTAPSAATHQGMVYAVQHPIGGHLVYPGVGRCWAMEQSWMLTEMAKYARYELRDIDDADDRARICGIDPGTVRTGVKAVMLVDPVEKASAQAQAVYEAGTWPTIYLTGPGGSRGFQRKQHISDTGRVPDTWWPHEDVGHNRSAKNEIKALFEGAHPFATPKPERLLQRILHIATDPGDLVLDCFAGSGTTAAVAHKMGRRWVTVELSPKTVETFVVPRLRKVVDGSDAGGISAEEVEHDDESDLPDGMAPVEGKAAVAALDKLRDHGTFASLDTDVVKLIQSVLRKAAKDPEGLPNGVDADTVKAMVKTFKALNDAELFADLCDTVTKKVTSALRAASKTRTETVSHWGGGGGFHVLEVAPSMYGTIDDYLVLAEWMTAGELAQGVAAQVGYIFEPDGPFTGRKGRSRLAVIDGLLTRDVIDFLVDQLAEKERLLVVAHALEPGVEEYVRDKVAGSRVRKIPRDLVRTTGEPRRLVNLAERPAEHAEAVEEVAS